MHYTTTALAIALAFVPAMYGRPVARAQPTVAQTVWDGAYTEDQAARGTVVYAAACSSCHAADLRGQGGVLIGNRFMNDWREDNLDSLFRRIKATMPRGAPGSLTDAEYLDLVAFVLKQNGFPGGEKELNAEVAPGILLVAKSGPQPVPDFAMVQLQGCLTDDAGSWTLTHATEPGRTRTPDLTPEELKLAGATPLGSATYRLMDALAYHPESHNGQRTGVKGLLIRRPENRINVTALETIGDSCAP